MSKALGVEAETTSSYSRENGGVEENSLIDMGNFSKVIGSSKPLPTTDLPTLRDALQQLLLLKEEHVSTHDTDDLIDTVTKMVLKIWSRVIDIN